MSDKKQFKGLDGVTYQLPSGWDDAKVMEWFGKNHPEALEDQTYIGTAASEPSSTYGGTWEYPDTGLASMPARFRDLANVMAEIAPYALSAGAVVAAPEVGIPASAGLLARMGAGAGSAAIRMGAAGAGMGAGGMARDVIQTGETQPLENYSSEVLAGAAGEGIASGALGVAGAAYRPIAKAARGFNEETTTLAGTAKAMGLPVGQGMLARGPASRAMQALTEYSPVGQFALRQRAASLQEATNKWSRDFVDDFGLRLPYAPGTRLETGMGIGKIFEGIDDAKQFYDLMGKEIRAHAEKSGGWVYMPETTAFLRQVRDEVARVNPTMTSAQLDNATVGYLGFKASDDVVKKTIRPLIRGEAVYGDNAIDLSTRVYPRKSPEFEKMTPVTRDLRGSLKESVLADYSGMGNSELIKRRADEIRKASREFFKENPTARKISRAYNADPEKMVDVFWKAKPEELVRMRGALLAEEGGPQAWAGLRFQAVKDLFDSAITYEKMTGRAVFDPGTFLRNWDEMLPRFQAAAPSSVKQLQPYVDTLRKTAPYFTGPNATTVSMTLAAQGIAYPFLGANALGGYNALGAMAAWATLGTGERALLKNFLAGSGKAAARAGVQYKGMGFLDALGMGDEDGR